MTFNNDLRARKLQGHILAIALLASASGANAQDDTGMPQVVKSSIRATVLGDVETIVPFETFPNAQCELAARDESGNVGRLILYADDLGIVRIHINPGQTWGQRLTVTASCKAGDQSETIPVEVRSDVTPTGDFPATRNDLAHDALQRLGTKLAPLAGDAAAIPQEELASMGYPYRPDPVREPEAYAAWLRMVSKGFRYIAPKLVSRPDRQHGTQNSSIWCGHAQTPLITSYWPGFSYVDGAWIVPNVSSPSASFYGTAIASVWAGLDGFGNQDVVQAGTDSEVASIGWWTLTSYSPWYEWFPADSVYFSNVPVNPGDKLETSIYSPVGANWADVCLQNDSIGGFSCKIINGPPNTVNHGISAEWILERPSYKDGNGNLVPYTLAPFGLRFFPWTTMVNTVAYGSGVAVDTWIQMVNPASGDRMCSSVPTGPESLDFFYWTSF